MSKRGEIVLENIMEEHFVRENPSDLESATFVLSGLWDTEK